MGRAPARAGATVAPGEEGGARGLPGPAPFFAALARAPETAGPDDTAAEGAAEAAGHAVFLRSADGLRLRLAVWPLASGRGTVILATGRTEYAEKYGPVAAALARHGFAAVAVDWRGQGLSDRLLPDRRIGHVVDFAQYQLDLAAVIDAVNDGPRSGGILRDAGLPGPRHLLAHSMGGCIGLRGLMQGLPVASAAFSAPMWGIAMTGNPRLTRLFAAVATGAGFGTRHAPPPATGPVSYVATAPFAGNLLTRDAMRFAWMKDHLARQPELTIAGPSIGWVHAALRECRRLAARPSPGIPVLTGLGSNERIVDPRAVRERMARWPAGRLEIFEGAEHELLMEAEPDRSAFLDACAAHFARHG